MEEVALLINIKSSNKTELIDITSKVQEIIEKSGIVKGFCFLFVPHTTGAVIINESADPDVKSDILMILNQIVPWKAGYRHGEGNSPAHVKSTLVGASEWVPIENRRLSLGTWQGIFFCEFDGPRTRKIRVDFLEQPSEK